MKENSYKVAKVILYLGTLPFVIMALKVLFNLNILPGFTVEKFYMYGVGMMTFIGGMWWGWAITESSGQHDSGVPYGVVIVVSNLMAILAWLTFLVPNMKYGLILYSVIFTIQLLEEFIYIPAGVISKKIVQLRFWPLIIAAISNWIVAVKY